MATTFNMLIPRHALPEDPMLLESTLPAQWPIKNTTPTWAGWHGGPDNMLRGPDGEPWSTPGVWAVTNNFGLLTGWEEDMFLLTRGHGPMTDGTAPPLDDDAEQVALPPGLLNSLPHDGVPGEVQSNNGTATLPRFFDAITTPPLTPAIHQAPGQASQLPPLVAPLPRPDNQRRQSERQRVARAATPLLRTVTQRAVAVKNKKMGTATEARTPKADKKELCLAKYTGNDTALVQRAFEDLLQEAVTAPP